MWFLDDAPRGGPARPGRELFRFLGRMSLLVLLCYVTAVVYGSHLYAWYAAFRLNDLGKFLQTARLMRAGCPDPYAPGFHTLVEVEGVHRHFLDLNPPQFHLLLYPLTGLSNEMAAGIWLLVQFTTGAAGLMIIWRSLNFDDWPPRSRIGLLFLLLLSTPTLAILITGQFTLVLFLLVTLAWRDIRTGRWTRGSLFLGIGLGIKPFFLILLPWLLIRRKWAATLTFLGSALLLYGIGFAVQGPHRMEAWLGALRSVDWLWVPMNASLSGFLERCLSYNMCYIPLLDAPRLLTVVRPLMILGIAALSLIRAVRRKTADVDHELALLMTSAQLIQPLGHVYYTWVGVAPLIAVGMTWKNGIGSTGNAWLANVLVVVAFVGLVFPLCYFPLHPLITVSVGSVYFWALSALWLFLITFPSEAG